MKNLVQAIRTGIFIYCAHFVSSIKFPNDVEGSPTIQCGQDTIVINVQTTNGNASRIFAKGHYDDNKCSFQSTNSAVFSLSGCGMTRQRQLEPRGLSYDLVVVVQLHPMFITKVDKAYNLKCFYMEAEKIVTSNLEVSMIRTDVITAGTPMPQCTYSLHLDSANGPLVKYTKVGDKVFHVWECPSDVYGILVHTCYVTDGQGNNFQIVDQNGCGVDKYVIRTPEYSNDLSKAQQETHVFKFADKMVVFFNCQIKLCVRANGGCKGISPPDCPSTGGTDHDHATASSPLVSHFPSPPTFSSSYQRPPPGHNPNSALEVHGTTNAAYPMERAETTNDTKQALLRTTKLEKTSHEATISFFEINVNILKNFTDTFEVVERQSNFSHYFVTTTGAPSQDTTTVEIGQNIDSKPVTKQMPDRVRDETTDRKRRPVVKITPINSTTQRHPSRNVDEEESSGEENEGFLTLTKQSNKNETKRVKNASFVDMQRDEPNLRKLRRLPDRYDGGVDLETDVNQQMWVLEPEEAGSQRESGNNSVDHFPAGSFRIIDKKNENDVQVCIPGWGFAVLISTFIILLIILFLSFFCICATKSHFARVSATLPTKSIEKCQF